MSKPRTQEPMTYEDLRAWGYAQEQMTRADTELWDRRSLLLVRDTWARLIADRVADGETVAPEVLGGYDYLREAVNSTITA